MTTETKTVQQFVEEQGITADAKPADRNPTMADDKWAKGASHWLVTLSRGERTMTVPYSMGSAHRRWKRTPVRTFDWTPHDAKRYGYKPGGRVSQLILAKSTIWSDRILGEMTEPIPPDVADVLGCLAADAAGYDNARNFEDWAAEYGYDTDSRKAERTYRTVADQAKELRHFLDDEAYRELLYDVEPH